MWLVFATLESMSNSLAKPKVHVGVKQDVACLEVAVDDRQPRVLVKIEQPSANPLDDLVPLPPAQRLLPLKQNDDRIKHRTKKDFVEALVDEELVDKELLVFLDAAAEQAHQVLVLELRNQDHLVLHLHMPLLRVTNSSSIIVTAARMEIAIRAILTVLLLLSPTAMTVVAESSEQKLFQPIFTERRSPSDPVTRAAKNIMFLASAVIGGVSVDSDASVIPKVRRPGARSIYATAYRAFLRRDRELAIATHVVALGRDPELATRSSGHRHRSNGVNRDGRPVSNSEGSLRDV
ncbi:hypothetical protein U9M48_044398 [Paspalum notatum var. saurae]|uniref:Uncharacterized protein n=1 Tax=Paspalum notatum var. saurae TaxID=547442 RepID=A0AAQ3XJJ7_PASNO